MALYFRHVKCQSPSSWMYVYVNQALERLLEMQIQDDAGNPCFAWSCRPIKIMQVETVQNDFHNQRENDDRSIILKIFVKHYKLSVGNKYIGNEIQ